MLERARSEDKEKTKDWRRVKIMKRASRKDDDDKDDDVVLEDEEIYDVDEAEELEEAVK